MSADAAGLPGPVHTLHFEKLFYCSVKTSQSSRAIQAQEMRVRPHPRLCIGFGP